MEDRRYSDPIVVDSHGNTQKLSRVPFDERRLHEGWLQDLLERHPELLPIEDIEPAFAPLISIGREIGTAVGPIDNLFINPDGYVTLVETKLWRNPEARRQVVGQIVDYAKEVSHWDYELLDAQVRAAAGQGSATDAGLLGLLTNTGFVGDFSEAAFIDRVTRNLRRGRILLVIAGDGIRESVEGMADFLQQTPQLHFTLALVELLTYELAVADGSLLVVPQVVARTREITRAVVRVEGTGIESVHVSVDTTTEMARAPRRSPTLTEADFFELLREKVGDDELVAVAGRLRSDLEGMGLKIDWKTASFSAKLRDPGGSGEQLTMLLLKTYGGVEGGWLANKLPELGLPRRIAEEYFDRVADLFGDCQVKIQNTGDLAWTRPILLSELSETYDHFLAILSDTIDQIKAASETQSQEPM